MAEMQAELERVGDDRRQAGGGMVKVTLNGKGEMRGLKIDPKLADPDGVEVLEDLIVAAAKDAKAKVDEHTATEMAQAHRRPAAAAGHEAAVLRRSSGDRGAGWGVPRHGA